MTSSASPGEPRPADDPDRERYGWATRIYAAAHDEHPGWVEHGDGGREDVDSLLGDMLAEQVATLSEYLGLPPDEERSDADIADEIIRMRAELDRLREQRDAVLALCALGEYGATRWADPRPVPEWVGRIRWTLGVSE